jgi:cysteinyl-tRNA synthetase
MQFYDTMRRQVVPFTPIEAGKVNIYACGVTVYDYCHLGHARSYVVWDVLRRWLEHSGYQVKYVQNFTDVDDKIIARAKEAGVSAQAYAQKYIRAYLDDMALLNIRPADYYPKVMDILHDLKWWAEKFIDRGLAYRDGDSILFKIAAFKDYGKLSNRRDTEGDFALWKGAKADEPEFPEGRPGWHLECSKMIDMAFGGKTIDIHVGGMDLVFPHHENEIAQSESWHNHPLANHWMHNGMVTVNNEKMGKSLGNAWILRDVKVNPNAIRLWILQSHYRKPLDTSGLEPAQVQWSRLKRKLQAAPSFGVTSEFKTALDDDFNTSRAIAELHAHPTKEMADLLGLKVPTTPDSIDEDRGEISDMIVQREDFRRDKKWADSDRMRKEIEALGYKLLDRPDGTTEVIRL